MIAYLYGPRASLDHRAGPCLAALELPDGSLVDPERARARIPDDPAEWISGQGLLLHSRTGLMGVVALSDGYSRDGVAPTRPPAGPPPPKKRHLIPRDLVCCLRCGRLALVARSRDSDASWLVEPSRWIAESIGHHAKKLGAAVDLQPRKLPGRAGEPHWCFDLFGE